MGNLEETHKAKNEGALNFKAVRCFNLALLAKQIRRVLNNPNLLVSKLLKAKYYSKGSLLESQPPQNSSWFWKGIMSAKNLMKEGLRKRLGDRKTVRIWENSWIPFTSDGKYLSTSWHTVAPLDMKANSLNIDVGIRTCWKICLSEMMLI